MKRTADIHADDYGNSINGSRMIIECLKNGKLDSISIIPNMDCFEDCMKMLSRVWKELPIKPQISVHLNLCDGKSLFLQKKEMIQTNSKDTKEAIDIGMVDTNGYFAMSWGKLLIISLMGGRKRKQLMKLLSNEIECQIEIIVEALHKYGCSSTLRIDSHQHTHMIPVVSDALLNVIDKRTAIGEKTEFVRVAREPLFPFVSMVRLYLSYRPINLVKCILLNFFSKRLEKKLKKRFIEYGYLWGLLMSGHMDPYRVNLLNKRIVDYATSKGKTLEVLFHPGRMEQREVTKEYVKTGFVDFYVSKDRDVEFESVNSWCRTAKDF